MRPTLLLITLAAACAAQAPPDVTPDVTLAARPAVVHVGDSVTVVLTTSLAGGIGYNLCTSQLERRDGDAWSAVPSDRVCTMELRTLEPGAEASFTFPVSAEITSGEYRYVARIERLASGEMQRVETGPFRVE